MKIEITCNQKEEREIRESMKSWIVNYNEWENGKEELKYKINNLVSTDVSLNIKK